MTFYPLSNASCAQRWNVRKNYLFQNGVHCKNLLGRKETRKGKRLWILNVHMQK
jgi:hypothetical protein